MICEANFIHPVAQIERIYNSDLLFSVLDDFDFHTSSNARKTKQGDVDIRPIASMYLKFTI